MGCTASWLGLLSMCPLGYRGTAVAHQDPQGCDVRESLPLSLSSRSSDGNERFLLGTLPRFWRSSWGAFFFKPGLVCVGQTSNESAPPVWYSISRTSVIRGLAWRTKTTTKGQAFGCVAHGFMSVSTHTWLLVWLRHLDVVFKEADPASVDFLIPQTTINWSCHLSWNPCVMWMHSTICENMWPAHGSKGWNPRLLHPTTRCMAWRLLFCPGAASILYTRGLLV